MASPGNSGDEPFNPSKLLRRMRDEHRGSRQSLGSTPMVYSHETPYDTQSIGYMSTIGRPQSVLHTYGESQAPSMSVVSRMKTSYEISLQELESERQAHAESKRELDRLKADLETARIEYKSAHEEMNSQLQRIAVLDNDNRRLQQEVTSLRQLIPSKLEELVKRASSIVSGLGPIQPQGGVAAPAQPTAQVAQGRSQQPQGGYQTSGEDHMYHPSAQYASPGVAGVRDLGLSYLDDSGGQSFYQEYQMSPGQTQNDGNTSMLSSAWGGSPKKKQGPRTKRRKPKQSGDDEIVRLRVPSTNLSLTLT
ncbi:chromosome segregation protein [Carpediemonas membranifera]|uniref:Chromosome segregation protein n=1 Tax=Carpediemonas membranifera TaxID=201153 RepID=A0A8J6B0C3_9EUKA|nr:chromosome segregation protein [Carpediemonas membranifera]|eukprot:KAG9391534.1 chromosome segregation protein [Carpediemonas membranifera]